MLSQTDAVKQAWAAANRTLDIIVTVDGKDYQATEINSLNYDAGAFTGDTLGIGSTYENSVTIEFSSVVEAFKQGLTVLPKVGVLVNGTFEYTNLGTFIVSEVNRDRNNNLTTIKALDQMCKLEGQYKPTVSDTASPLDIIADIANQGCVAVNTGELQHLPALPNIKRIDSQTLRTAIGWVAQLYGGFAAFDRDGKLTIRTTASPDYTITPSEYQQGGLTKNEVAYKTGGIKVTVNTKKTDDSGQDVDDITTLQAGETTGSQIELTNDSMTNDLLTTVWTGIKDITYYPYMLNWFGNPNLEAGDWVTLTDMQGNQFNVPINQYTMSFNGGLESTISATQSSSTAGGYAYTGSAGSIKNMIESLQVRHTASGNNVYPPSYQGQPQNPKKGDVWYKQNGNNIEVWIYQEDDGKLAWVRTPLDGEVRAELQALGKKTDEDLTRVKSDLSSEAERQWQSMKAATSEVANDLSATKDNLAAVKSDLSSTKSSLADTGRKLETTVSDFQRETGKLSGSINTANSKIEFNSNAIAEVKHTADAIRADLTNTKGDVASVKATASSLSSDIANAKGDISSLQQKADSLTSTVGQMPAKWQQAINDKASAQVLTNNVDMNNLTTAGTYLIQDFSVKNAPISAWFMATVEATSDHTRVVQRVKRDADNVAYERSYYNNEKGWAWTAWERIATGTDVSSIRQTMDSITTRVSNTEGNISSLQQKADSLTSTVGQMPAKWQQAINDKASAQVLTNNVDMNNLTTAGTYLIQDFSVKNAPISAWFMATVEATSDHTRVVQRVKRDADNVAYERSYYNNEKGWAWTAWERIATGTDVSSIRQTMDSITTRVSNTEGNISSLQETAKELKATVGDDNTGLVSQIKAIPGQISSAITASNQVTVITSAVDVHNMTTAGYYLLKGTLTNSPVDAWAFLRVIKSDSGDRIYHSIWKDVSSTVYTEYWAPGYLAGGWSDWSTHIDADNLKSNVITAINQSTEGVSITGAKITLDGNVNVAPGFTLSADYINTGKMKADRISGGTLNFNEITVTKGLTANSISSGSISGQNLNINLDNGVIEFTKGNLHSTDGGFNISIDTKSFYLDTGNGSKLWINSDGFHLQESASQHLWMNKDGLHNYTDTNGNGIQINDTELKVLNSNNAGLIAKDGILQFSANPIWNSANVYSGTLNDQTYGTIGFNSNLLSSSLNGIFIRGREGVVIGTNSYDGGSMLIPADPIPLCTGSGINLPEPADKPASIFTKSSLTLFGGNRYPDDTGFSPMASISIGCDFYYQHNGTALYRNGSGERGNQIYAEAQNVSFKAKDWINLYSRGRIALSAQFVHSYPTYNQTTSAGANVFVAPDGALIRSSSARKYKTDIQDAENDYGKKLIEFTPQKWIDKAEKKRYEEDPENNKKPGYYYGLIADDLDAAGLDMLVNYGAEGEVEGINYDRLAVALLPVIKSLKDQVASLKEQLKALTK